MINDFTAASIRFVADPVAREAYMEGGYVFRTQKECHSWRRQCWHQTFWKGGLHCHTQFPCCSALGKAAAMVETPGSTCISGDPATWAPHNPYSLWVRRSSLSTATFKTEDNGIHLDKAKWLDRTGGTVERGVWELTRVGRPCEDTVMAQWVETRTQGLGRSPSCIKIQSNAHLRGRSDQYRRWGFYQALSVTDFCLRCTLFMVFHLGTGSKC